MGWWAVRKRKKLTKQLLHDARFARHMRMDVASEEILRDLDQARDQLEALSYDASEEDFITAADHLQASVFAAMPTTDSPRLRENIEVAVVAIAIAMGIRTYFLQPFKIPTGSMQPTLYGITYESKAVKGFFDFLPMSTLKFLSMGDRYVEMKAPASGVVRVSNTFYNGRAGDFAISVGGKTLSMSKNLKRFFQPNQMVNEGDVLASGVRRSGDHILVNKLKYHFMRPQRGDIVVFRTNGIQHPKFSVDDVKTHYIKRLTGLPQETISISPEDGRLRVNGTAAESPGHFKLWSYSVPDSRADLTPPVLSDLNKEYYIPADAYLMMGDNTNNSFDGRYFGAIPERNVVGEAFAVHWPFRRFGPKS